MGMFDYLHCKYPLPVEGANALEFQTKDTPSQFMDRYEIKEDGSLWGEDYDIEDKSDPNAEGLMALFGCMSRVNIRQVPCKFTGELVFYTSWDGRYNEEDHEPGWIEFSSYFVDGKLKELHVLENKPAGPKSKQ